MKVKKLFKGPFVWIIVVVVLIGAGLFTLTGTGTSRIGTSEALDLLKNDKVVSAKVFGSEGRVDLECGDTTNTRERRDKLGMAFSVPYYIAGTRMLVRTDSNITRIEDMGNKTIVTTKGTTSAEIVKEKEAALMIRIGLLECDETPKCFDMVAQRKADAWLMDDIMLYSLRAVSAKPETFAVVGKFMSIEPLTVMMRKGDADLKKLVDTEMKKMVYSQQIAGLYKKWFESPIAPQGVNLRIPMSYLLRDSLKFPTDNIGD